MTWKCSNCEAENQDVTPVCTVCDNIAPVIQSYLSLENIESSRKYNELLDSIHLLEVDADYEGMLSAAMEAVSIYKYNDLALDKAKQALIYLNKADLEKHLREILKKAIDENNQVLANLLFSVFDDMRIVVNDLADTRNIVSAQLSQQKEIDKKLEESYKAIVELEFAKAMQIVEGGLSKYDSNEQLQSRREDIKILVTKLNSTKQKETRRKYPPISQRAKGEVDSPAELHHESSQIIELGTQPRNFPIPKRN